MLEKGDGGKWRDALKEKWPAWGTNDAVPAGYPQPWEDVQETKQCSHNLTPFAFQATVDGEERRFTIYLSGWRDVHGKSSSPDPDCAIYLSQEWLKGRIIGVKGSNIVYLGWPDMKDMDIRPVRRACRWATNSLKLGHRLEIGCFGGHGRTGTMVSLLMVHLGWQAEDAIKEVRGRYCQRAVETQAQEKMVMAAEKQWKKEGANVSR